MLARFSLIILSFSLFFLSSNSKASNPEQIHIVLDISGNMQTYDPDLQRIKALNELINQLPEGSKAGIWTYAKQTNNLVPVGNVNDAWRTKAKEAVSKLRGYGPFTNLTKVIEDATYAWRTNKVTSERKLVLFTAGGVNPSLNSAENQASNDKLFKLLPTLDNSKVMVYPIAFTANADVSLLKKLAEETHGQYFQAAGTDDLASSFMQLNAALKDSTATKTTAVAMPKEKLTTENTEITPAEPNSEMLANTNQSVAEIAAAAATKPTISVSTETAKSSEIREALSLAEEQLGSLLTEYAAIAQEENEIKPDPLVITLDDGSVFVTPGNAKAPIKEAQPPKVFSDVSNEFQTPRESTLTDTVPETAVVPTTNFSENILPEHPEKNVSNLGWFEKQVQNDFWALVLTILVSINLAVILLLIMGRFIWLRYYRKQSDEVVSMEEVHTET